MVRQVLSVGLALLAFAVASADASADYGDAFATSNVLRSSSSDGVHRFVTTRDPLVRADDDHSIDLYDIYNGSPTLVSIGPDGGNRDGVCSTVGAPFVTESCDVVYRAVSPDGNRVFFQGESLRSSEPANGVYRYVREGAQLGLAPQVAETPDAAVRITTDGNGCLYRETDAGSTLVSTGPALASGCARASLAGLSDDGNVVLFTTPSALVASDTCCTDLYRWTAARVELLSKGPTGQGGVSTRIYRQLPYSEPQTVSPDGERALFATTASLIAADTDSCLDLYESTPTGLALLSGSSGPGCQDAEFVDATRDLSRVFFETADPLDPADTNGLSDVYEWHAGTASLVGLTQGGAAFPLGSKYLDASRDGTRVFFFAADRVNSPGSYGEGSLYVRAGAATTVLSDPDPAWEPGDWAGASDDGLTVYFNSGAPLVAEDTDDQKVDLYRSSGGDIELVSAGPSGEQTLQSSFDAGPGDPISADGERAVFHSVEELTWDDTDCGRVDFYEAVGSGVRLITAAADAPTIAAGPCEIAGPNAHFELGPATPGGGLECRIDEGTFDACSSSFTTPPLAEGEHVLFVRGADAGPGSGVADRRFTIEPGPPPDVTPPDTSLDGPYFDAGPQLPRFHVSSTEGSGSLECSWDGEAFRPCADSSPGSGFDQPDAPLAYGDHTFAARAVDAAGNVDPTPAEASVTIAEDPPVEPPPALSLDVSSTQLARTLVQLRRATRIVGSCEPECQVTAELAVGKRVARRLGLDDRRLISASEIWSGGEDRSFGTVVLHQTKTVRQALRGYRGRGFRIRVTVTAERGEERTSQTLSSRISGSR